MLLGHANHDPSLLIMDRAAGGEIRNLVESLRHAERRDAVQVTSAENEIEDLRCRQRIEPQGRLVVQHDRRIADEGAREL